MRHFRFILIPAVLFLLAGFAFAGWIQQQSGTTDHLDEVFFLDSLNGWVLGDSCFVLRTTNGGQIWQRDTLDPNFSYRSIWFHDTCLGWVVGGRDSSGHSINELFATTDGGIHWQAIYRDTMESMSFSDLEFVTPLKGWLVGSQLYSNGGGIGYLFFTSDGGASWSLKDSSHAIYWGVSFADSLNGYLAAGNPGITESCGFMKKTTDGGGSWQGVSSGFTMYSGVLCLDRNHVWFSWYWNIFSDRRWGVTCGSGGLSGLGYRNPPFVAVDTLKGWILFPDTLFTTRDGGATWSRQIPPGPYKCDFCFVDSLNGWIVGYNGLILHTTDGGSGVWEEPSRLTPNASRLAVSPNPFTSFASVPGHERDRFALYDISGRRVGTYKGDRIGEGLVAGVYFVKSEGKDAKPLQIVKLR
jgi:photosystem II stability/assembly factor-like uncharacterized protein